VVVFADDVAPLFEALGHLASSDVAEAATLEVFEVVLLDLEVAGKTRVPELWAS
jgi:hypothetical protein